jgi:hypothetical protein
LIVLTQYLHKYLKRRKARASQARIDGAGPQQRAAEKEPPARIFEMPAGPTYVIVRKDGAVWAGPWKNDGRSFTRVPKNWWIFKTKVKASQEVQSNDYLRLCTVEEAA